MGIYDDLVARKGAGSPFDELTTEAPATQQPDDPPWDALPEDYVAFLREVGWGAFASDGFMLYSGLIAFEDIYGRRDSEFSDVRLFGDDMAGYSVGYRLPDWRLVELDPRGRGAPLAAPDFQSFIRERIAREDEIMAGQEDDPA